MNPLLTPRSKASGAELETSSIVGAFVMFAILFAPLLFL